MLGRSASFPFPVRNPEVVRSAIPEVTHGWTVPRHRLIRDHSGNGKREASRPVPSSRPARSTITLVDPLRTGARLLSKGMRGGNGALTLLGALLAARGIVRWLERPDRELLYSKRLKPGQSLRITVPKGD